MAALVVLGVSSTLLEPVFPALPSRLLNLDSEASLPTTFSVLVWAGTAATFLALGLSTRRAGGAGRPYLVLAGLFGYITLDEGASLHELLGSAVRSVLGSDRLATFDWVVPGAVIALAVGLLLRVARRIPPVMRRRLAVAAVLFLLGALGFEALSGTVVSAAPVGWSPGAGPPPQRPVYVLLTGLDEGLEMVGAVLALRAGLLALLVRKEPDGFRVTPAPAR